MSDESKITEFPLEKSGGGEEELWKCQACKHIITERMDELMIYICPNCRTLQLPQEVFDQIFKKANSKIIT